MRTIAIMNQKGGCGKTTACLHLGVGLARAGERVQIIDADRQRSAFKWSEKAQLNKRAAPPVGQAQPESIGRAIEELKGDADITIIDTAGDFKAEAQKQAMGLLPMVDLVVIPILPTPLDVDGVQDLLTALRAYTAAHEKAPQVVLLLNKSKRNALTRMAREVLPKYGFPLLETSLQDRVAYAEQIGFGGTAFDRRPSDKARVEAQALVDEVRKYL